jgi:hypothetical protein
MKGCGDEGVEWSEQRPTRRRVAAIRGGDGGGDDVIIMRGVCDGDNLRPDMMCELLLS